MAKKQYALTKWCHHDGCGESAFYRYLTKSDYAAAETRYREKGWWCHRHDPNGKNVNASSQMRTIEKEIVCCVHNFFPLEGEHFWDTSSGFAYGDEWNAYAKDFPVGAKIVVKTTITVVLPGVGETIV